MVQPCPVTVVPELGFVCAEFRFPLHTSEAGPDTAISSTSEARNGRCKVRAQAGSQTKRTKRKAHRLMSSETKDRFQNTCLLLAAVVTLHC